MRPSPSLSTDPIILLTALFGGALVLSSILATKLVAVGPLVAPAGVLAFSITFICTDIAHEVYGQKTAKQMVKYGFFALVIALGLSQMAIWWPYPSFWDGQEAFAKILQPSIRVMLAGLIAYLFSQSADIWLFGKLRALSNGRMLWLRNTCSTACSQLLDTTVFIVLAFWGSPFSLGELILGQWVLKLAIAVLDTPFVYLGVWWCRHHGSNTNDA